MTKSVSFLLAGLLALALLLTSTGPVVPALFMAGAVAALVRLQIKHWVPTDFRAIARPRPYPPATRFDDTVAREDGQALAATPMAKAGAVLISAAATTVLALALPWAHIASAVPPVAWLLLIGLAGVALGVILAPLLRRTWSLAGQSL